MRGIVGTYHRSICVLEGELETHICGTGKKIHFHFKHIYPKNKGLKFYSDRTTFCSESMQVKKRIIIGTLKRHKNLSHQSQLSTCRG